MKTAQTEPVTPDCPPINSPRGTRAFCACSREITCDGQGHWANGFFDPLCPRTIDGKHWPVSATPVLLTTPAPQRESGLTFMPHPNEPCSRYCSEHHTHRGVCGLWCKP